MQPPWDFFAKNKDAITTILAVLGALAAVAGVIWAAFKWGILRWWQNRVRIDVKVFEVISDPSVLLPKLYATENDDSPLADHIIKYQPRDPKQDLQADLKAALNRSRYLLITAPTGVGKTREAGMLAQTMILEGWRVLRIKPDEWLDIPKTLPKELGGNPSRVLIFLDNLTGMFGVGQKMQSPRVENEKNLMLSQLSYHDRLLQMLDMFESMCTESEIRVIATARSEAEQWKLLEYNEKDRLWKRFERIEISKPIDATIVNLLEDAIKQANLKADESEFKSIAYKSDGTYRNILLNLRRFRSQNRPVSKDDFTDTLDGSWKNIYDRAVKKYPAVSYVYDAIDVLQQARIELLPFLVEPTALIVWGGNYFQRFLRQREINRAIRYLTKDTSILRQMNGKLTPSDGQSDVKDNRREWSKFADDLEMMLLEKSTMFGEKLVGSLWRFGLTLEKSNYLIQAIKLWQKGAEISRKSLFWYEQGDAFKTLKRYDESEEAYRKAIAVDPNDSYAYRRLGDFLEELQRFPEAEEAYRKAIDLNPTDADNYNNLGAMLNDDLKQPDKAETAFRKVIELDPTYIYGYPSLGNSLRDQGRYEEAEAAYRKSIELNPSYTNAYSNLGNLLINENLKQYEEAEAIYRKAIELNLSDTDVYINLGNLLSNENLKRYEEAEAIYRKAIELNPSGAAYINLGILLKNLNRYEEAEASYRKAIEQNPSDTAAYSNLGLLLKNLKRYEEAEMSFRKAIKLNPSDTTAYNDLGLLLHEKLKRHEEAEAIYRKTIEINPLDADIYDRLGALLNDELRQPDKAEVAFRKAIDLDPTREYRYVNLGNSLRDQSRYEEAESAYRKVIELNPLDAAAYSNLGILLQNLRQFEKAEASYRKAIELNPSDATAYKNLVSLLRFKVNDRTEDVLPLLEKAIGISPEDFDSYLAIVSISKQLGKEVSNDYAEKVRQFMSEDDFYNRACLESVCDNFDLAFAYLHRAAQQEGFNPTWAWEDPDFQWIRDDSRFAEIVGPKPEK